MLAGKMLKSRNMRKFESERPKKQSRPLLRSAIPNQEQRFEMRDAVNLLENELIDLLLGPILLCHFPRNCKHT